MDPLTIKCLFGAAGSGNQWPSGFFGFEVYDSSSSITAGGRYQSDGLGNVYGYLGRNILKVNPGGTIAWQRTCPGIFTLAASNQINNIAVSQNGTYVVLVGRGGTAVYSDLGSEAVISRINPSTGEVSVTHTSISSLTNRTAQFVDVVVDDNGICNAVGDHYRVLNAPYSDFLRFCVDLSTNDIKVNEGSTGGTYSEQFFDVDQNDTYTIMGGIDISRPQSGYQQYNWSLFGKSNSTRSFSNSYQSNGGNGVYGQGVTIDSSNNIFVGYGILTSGSTIERGILKFNTSGTILERKSIYISSVGDINITYVTNDDINVYVTGVDSTYSQTIIFCLDISTLSLQWSRRIYSNSSNIRPLKLRYNVGTNKLDLSVTKSVAGYSTYLSLPVDGTGTGTYGDYIYENYALNIASTPASVYSASPPSFGGWTYNGPPDTNSSYSNFTIQTF